MKTIKSILAIAFLIFIGFYSGDLIVGDNKNYYYVGVILVFATLFLFNLIVRSNPKFKRYFISPWNVFSSSYSVEEVYDMPQELLYEQLKEVLEKSFFVLKYTNNRNMELMAKSSFCWKSWGENIYITIRKNEKNETVMNFYSVALMQIYSWGKNEENYKLLTNSIEDSLTI
jgi:hypothetical protein